MQKEREPCDDHQSSVQWPPLILHSRNVLAQKVDYELGQDA